MNLVLTNSEGEYDFSKWAVDLSGLRFRVSYTDRYGQPGQAPQGDRKESGRNIVLTYSVDGETDAAFISDAEALYAALRAEVAPFYLVDDDNGRRLEVSPDSLDLNPKAGTELRYASARVQFTAVGTFWESTTETEVDSGSAALDNGESLSCTNEGSITIYPVITVEPTELNQNFAIFNDTTADLFTFSSSSFAPGTTLEIDCREGTVYLTNGSTVTEVSNGIADGTGFLHLVPGVNSLRYVSAFGPVTMTVSFRRRWAF
jgi:hypothetical protein